MRLALPATEEAPLMYWPVLLIGLLEGVVSAKRGLEELDGVVALMEACAVFTESEEVGGPEQNMERAGVLKSVCCGALLDELPVSGKGAEAGGATGPFVGGEGKAQVGF